MIVFIVTLTNFAIWALFTNQAHPNVKRHKYGTGEYVSAEFQITSRSMLLDSYNNSTRVFLLPISDLQLVTATNFQEYAVPSVPGNTIYTFGLQYTYSGEGSVYNNLSGTYCIFVFCNYTPTFGYGTTLAVMKSVKEL